MACATCPAVTTPLSGSVRPCRAISAVASSSRSNADSPTGGLLLIPQGTRLIGEYDDAVTVGQRRVLLVWTRLIFPDGRSLVLERQSGADSAGHTDLEDRGFGKARRGRVRRGPEAAKQGLL